MGKKKRGHPDAEEILARPWCYYCERDFDDLKILISHQKAKHFKCLSVHMNQVHKETLTTVENALPNRSNLDVEIFGMEGIPEEVVAAHNQRVLGQIQQAEAERRATTGNPVSGGASSGGPKKPKFETPAEIKKRLAEHKAKMAEQAAGGSSGGGTPVGAGQAVQSPAMAQSPPSFQAGSSPYPPQHAQYGAPPITASFPPFPSSYEQPAYQQAQHPYSVQQPPQGYQSPGLQGVQPYPVSGQPYSGPPAAVPPGGPGFPQHFQGNSHPYAAASPPVPFHQGHQHPPRNHTPPQNGPLPQRPGSLPPAAPGLPQRPSFGAPAVNARQMQQMHQGQVIATGPPPGAQLNHTGLDQGANGTVPHNRPGSLSDVPHAQPHEGLDHPQNPPVTAAPGQAASLDDLVASAARDNAKPEAQAPEKKTKKEKDKDKAMRLVYSDEKISPEEKMASLPRYAFVPPRNEETVLGDATTAAVAGAVVGSDEVLDKTN
ncbi:MAG: hypothetical protein M1832_004994 [Thelocarpon impressellum]|nr:MAG: hypothetical protein M1832_004994 [Thelocarpon impressellum]